MATMALREARQRALAIMERAEQARAQTAETEATRSLGLEWRCMFLGCPNDHPSLEGQPVWSADWRQDNTAGARHHCAVDFCSAECLDGWKQQGGPRQHLEPGSRWPWTVVEGSYREHVPE